MDGPAEAGSRNLASSSQDTAQGDQSKRSPNKQVARKSVRKLPRLPAFWTIGKAEKINAMDALRRPLSGYIGGRSNGGYWCTRLADEWCCTFHAQYAVPCNSATSGLLAACLAAGVEEGDLVWVSDYTMSASATCALLLGAEVKFLDIDPVFFTMKAAIDEARPKAIIVTNLFGHPADLKALKSFCDKNNIILIEDNAQAPFAQEGGTYTGTIGHIGVFSLNVHKHIQCGEGGVVVTNDPQLAHRLDCAINHGELMRVNPNMGLNFRMTEPVAAIASAQLKKGEKIVQTRIALAEELNDIFSSIEWVETPKSRAGCRHVYYMWAGKVVGDVPQRRRKEFLARLAARRVPFREGYSVPLHRLFDPPEFAELYPITNDMEDHRLFCFEVCAYDPNQHHLKAMREIVHRAADRVK